MHIRDETTKLSAIRQTLRVICRGHSVSHGRYEHTEYWFSVDDGKVGTIAISSEWLAGIPVSDIGAELQRKGLTLHVVMQAGTYAGRDWLCNRVLQILGASELDSVHNHHNFVLTKRRLSFTMRTKRLQ